MTAAHTLTLAIAAWLTTCLLVETVLVARQWRHLKCAQVATDRRARYGRYRALLQWFATAESVLRVGFGQGTGALLPLNRPFASAGMAALHWARPNLVAGGVHRSN